MHDLADRLQIAAATRYSIIQFGLSTFHKCDTTPGGYVAHTYNFYLFPKSGKSFD